jgi:hypothetical protein
MDEQIIVLSNSSSYDSCNTEVLRAFVNRISKPLSVPNPDLVRGMCSINTTHFSEPRVIWAYSPQSSESGESVTQNVGASSRVLNPEPPIYVEVTRKSPGNPDDSAGEDTNPGRMLVKTNPIRPNAGNHPEDPDELSSSMTNSLDYESDPAYHPSSSPTLSSSLPGSNRSSCKLVDMVPKRTHRRATNVAGARHGQDDAEQAGPSRVHFNLQEMRTEWAGIRGINNLLWVPATWLCQPSAISS